jgi:exosortase/archaeosortase family protein
VRKTLPTVLLVPGLVALVAEPAAWLVGTWAYGDGLDPGLLLALGCVALAARSVASGPAPHSARAGIALLLVAAGVRLAGRLLDVSHIGAVALCLDVVALAVALGVRHRPRPIQPWALGGLFLLTLPAESLLQHFLGNPLRLVSARAAALVLRPLYPGLEHQGVHLVAPGRALEVDVACSGARGLLLLTTLALIAAAVRQTSAKGLAAGVGAVLTGALIANTTRLVLLFVQPAWLAQPAHTWVGLVGLALGALPLVWLLRRSSPLLAAAPSHRVTPSGVSTVRVVGAAAFSLLAIAVSVAPHRPLDVSAPVAGVGLPHNLGSWVGQDMAATDQERAYFDRYGGVLDRRGYETPAGVFQVIVVRTTAPVRHLHRPEYCLRGTGHALERLGVQREPVPTVVFRTTDDADQSWRVAATFASTDGRYADSVSGVFWSWVAQPGSTWMLVERIAPWDACATQPETCQAFDLALFTALDLEVPCSSCS